MTPQRGARIIDEAIRLLSRERDLLMAGRYHDLERTAQVRGEQVERLSALGSDAARALAPGLRSLRESADRNVALLKAALEGAATARRRLAALREAQTRLPSYDASGAPVEHVASILNQGRRA